MELYVKRNDGKIFKTYPRFCIGDYVKIKDFGWQYKTYERAFIYFWGDKETTDIDESNVGRRWKIINIALHANGWDLIYHIRSSFGENAVMGGKGLMWSFFHKRNRENVKNVLIYQLPSYKDPIPHHWKDKLWDFYEDGKIIKNKRKIYNLNKD